MSPSLGSAHRKLNPRAVERSTLWVQPAVGSGLPWWSKTHSEDKRTLAWACRVISACTPWETSPGQHPEPVGGGRPAEPHLGLLGRARGPCPFSPGKHWENISLSNYPCRSGDQEPVFYTTDSLGHRGVPFVMPVSPSFSPHTLLHPSIPEQTHQHHVAKPCSILAKTALASWLCKLCRVRFNTDLWDYHTAAQIPITQFVDLCNQALSQSIFQHMLLY